MSISLTTPALDAQSPRKLLLAASTGGHIAQLVRLAPGLGATDDSLWVTFALPRRGRCSKAPDAHGALHRTEGLGLDDRAYRMIRSAIADEQFEAAMSTGAALALAALPAARMAVCRRSTSRACRAWTVPRCPGGSSRACTVRNAHAACPWSTVAGECTRASWRPTKRSFAKRLEDVP